MKKHNRRAQALLALVHTPLLQINLTQLQQEDDVSKRLERKVPLSPQPQQQQEAVPSPHPLPAAPPLPKKKPPPPSEPYPGHNFLQFQPVVDTNFYDADDEYGGQDGDMDGDMDGDVGGVAGDAAGGNKDVDGNGGAGAVARAEEQQQAVAASDNANISSAVQVGIHHHMGARSPSGSSIASSVSSLPPVATPSRASSGHQITSSAAPMAAEASPLELRSVSRSHSDQSHVSGLSDGRPKSSGNMNSTLSIILGSPASSSSQSPSQDESRGGGGVAAAAAPGAVAGMDSHHREDENVPAHAAPHVVASAEPFATPEPIQDNVVESKEPSSSQLQVEHHNGSGNDERGSDDKGKQSQNAKGKKDKKKSVDGGKKKSCLIM